MLGRKAIHHKTAKPKKWKLELKSDDEEEIDLSKLHEYSEESPRKEPDRLRDDDSDGTDMECSDNETKGKKRKRFAWMDSDDEDDEDGEDDDDDDDDDDCAPVKPPDSPEESAISKAIRKALPTLPVQMGPEMIQLISRINTSKTFNELWELIDSRVSTFQSFQVCATLKRVVALKDAKQFQNKQNDLRLDKIRSFTNLRDRAFELLNDPDTRARFLPHEIGTFATAYAKCVPHAVPVDIYQKLANEALTRLELFSPTSVADLAWGVAQTQFSDRRQFFKMVAEWMKPKFETMTLEDLAKAMQAMACANYKPENFFELFFAHFKKRIDPELMPSNTQFMLQPIALVEIVSALGVLGAYDEELMKVFSKAILPKIYELKANHLQAILEAFDELRHDSDVDFLRVVRRALDSRNFNNPYMNRVNQQKIMKFW